MHETLDNQSSWLDRQIIGQKAISFESLIFGVILLIAVFSRFYNLEARVMSHDENSHVYYSWRLYRGEGFAHDPLMHGPLQFHMIALNYFMFGDNDFTARIPAALFSIGTVAFMWNYRRYLGKSGALIAAILMLISPYMLFYGRYARNEAYVALLGVITLWAILRYLETGKNEYLYWLSAAIALHFTAKETAFIYTAQAMIFLAFYFVHRVNKGMWFHPQLKKYFFIALFFGLVLFASGGIYIFLNQSGTDLSVTETVSPSVPGEDATQAETSPVAPIPLAIFSLGALSLLISLYFLIRGYTLAGIRKERSIDLLVILTTLVIPQLSAFPVRLLGWTIPTNASEVQALSVTDMLHIGIFLVPLVFVCVVVGLWWNKKQWLINAAIFYGIFTVFYTTVFTNGAGFFTGLVGSLGYWLEQQGVNRGSQPWYYYGFVQIPVYEYLPALGTLMLTAMVILRKRLVPVRSQSNQDILNSNLNQHDDYSAQDEKPPVLALLVFWAFASLLAYTIAGEKMPWLTVHIAWPMILCAGWLIGRIIDSIDWVAFKKSKGIIIILLLIIFLLSSISVLSSVLGINPPFQGKQLEQLRATSNFLLSFITAAASGAGFFYMVRSWSKYQTVLILILVIFAGLGFLTARTAIQANYINYDNANELLVYAHSARGVKTALAQIEEISQRTTDGLALIVAYDNETSYPYWWYLRNYPNARYYGADPTRSLREAPVILVGDANFGKIEPVVGQAYNRYDYIRLWWPNQDYFGLTWERILAALRDPRMRAALFQIWLNRDYTLYGKVKNVDMSLPKWSPSTHMRLYIRKDIVNQLWNYGSVPSSEPIPADPYEGKEIKLSADRSFGSAGNEPGQFQGPRDLAVAKDGSIYVADTDNNRIQHISQDGTILQSWGNFADVSTGSAPGGSFYQPWGIGVAPDGSIYIADTWNHRIQKFNSEGEFIRMWGYFGQGESPSAFWGPRDVAVDAEGRVFVTDTGNKRVVVFDADGDFLAEFGEAGLGPGQFDEPVGITISEDGEVYVTDTWNQRIQVFSAVNELRYQQTREWEVYGWFGQSLDNKPYIDVDETGNVYVTDPEGYRVLQFTNKGEIVNYWGDFGIELDRFGLPAGISTDRNGGVWVSDAGNHRIMHFTLIKP